MTNSGKEKLTAEAVTRIRTAMACADSELSAIAHGRPPCSKNELMLIANQLREAYEDPRFHQAMLQLALELNQQQTTTQKG